MYKGLPLLEVGSISSLFLLSGISFKVSPFVSRESLTSQVSGTFWRVPQPSISQGCLFPFFLLALRASVLFPHKITDQIPLFPLIPPPIHFPPRSLPPSPLVIAFFSLTSGTKASSLGHFSLLNFWVLWIVSWVFCIFLLFG
jgi:hypothetical protein